MAKKKTPQELKEAKIKRTEKHILDVIEKNRILFISNIFGCFFEISRRTFYEWGLHNSHNIKEAILVQRAKVKNRTINKWFDSDNPTMNAMGMKLIATEDEYKRLTNQPLEEVKDTKNNLTINVISEDAKNALQLINDKSKSNNNYADSQIDKEPTLNE